MLELGIIYLYIKCEELFILKKIIAMLMACLMLVGMTATVSVSAATPKESMIDACEEYMPEPLLKEYLPLIENILAQIEADQDQADQVIECIKESREFFKEFKGVSLHTYTLEERKFAVDMVARICEILGLTAKYTYSTDADHHNDMVCEIYDGSGRLIGVLDGDVVKKTNAPESDVNYGAVVLAAVVMIGAAGAIVAGKKFAAQR